MKPRFKGKPDDDPILPTLREWLGFFSPPAGAALGYWLGMRWEGLMGAVMCAMVGVLLGSFVTRAWSQDFYL